MKCEHDHTQPYTWWEVDARGIPLCKVCDDCVDERLAKYRPDVITDPNYWADEPIEPEEERYGHAQLTGQELYDHENPAPLENPMDWEK